MEALGFVELVDFDRKKAFKGSAGETPLTPPAMTWCDRFTARLWEGEAGRGVILRQVPSDWMDVLDDKRALHGLMCDDEVCGDPENLRAGEEGGGGGGVEEEELRGRGVLGRTARKEVAGEGKQCGQSSPTPALRLPFPAHLAEDFLRLASCDAPVNATTATAAATAWYVKHARGIKGKQVERHSTVAAARAWLQRLPAHPPSGAAPGRHPNDHPSQQDYIVQAEVPPLLLPDRRRFCIRHHVLLVVPPYQHRGRGRGAACRGGGGMAAAAAYSHCDVIMMPHAVPECSKSGGSGCGKGEDNGADGGGGVETEENDAAEGDKGRYVQQAGSDHPCPFLLGNTDAARSVDLRALERVVPGVDADRTMAQLEGTARCVLERFCRHVEREQRRVWEVEEGGKEEGEATTGRAGAEGVAGGAEGRGLTDGFGGGGGGGGSDSGIAGSVLPNCGGGGDGGGDGGCGGGGGGGGDEDGSNNSAGDDGSRGGWYYNLFGFDLVLERDTGDAVLLEVNVFPALAAGTVGAVPRAVFSRLVDDTLRLLAPILEADGDLCRTPPALGGFVDLQLG